MTAPRRSRHNRLALQGGLTLLHGGRPLGGPERFALLRAVAAVGSITHAAKAVGLSYKGAWEAIDAMNSAAGEPLVERATGGRGGGSTRLTPFGLQLLERFEALDAAHQRFVHLLGGPALALALDQPFSQLLALNMKTSARNQFVGTLTLLRSGAVNDEVELTLTGGARITAVLTRESTLALGLRNQMTVIALVKASAVLLATELQGARVSARNQLAGTVSAIKPGAVNAEVTIGLDGSADTLTAIVTQASAAELGLVVGLRVTALFQASDVILAVTP
jgi:molybdate transport system regulatory protein